MNFITRLLGNTQTMDLVKPHGSAVHVMRGWHACEVCGVKHEGGALKNYGRMKCRKQLFENILKED